MPCKSAILRNADSSATSNINSRSHCCDDHHIHIHIKFKTRVNKNLAIANRSCVSCINTNNNIMTLKSGLEVTQCH